MFIIFLCLQFGRGMYSAQGIKPVEEGCARGLMGRVSAAIWPTLINCLFVFVTGEN